MDKLRKHIQSMSINATVFQPPTNLLPPNDPPPVPEIPVPPFIAGQSFAQGFPRPAAWATTPVPDPKKTKKIA